ncbi:hypothetical protein TPY_0621 [Sulfobacillus acidophilus TPY]|nr:hypothetical protein TPY_0621 [Sulfobacillus acidophilus TPY]
MPARRLRYRIVEKLRETGAEAILVEAHPVVAVHLIGPGGVNLKELGAETGRAVFLYEGERRDVEIMKRHATNPKDGIARLSGYVIDT